MADIFKCSAQEIFVCVDIFHGIINIIQSSEIYVYFHWQERRSMTASEVQNFVNALRSTFSHLEVNYTDLF